MSTALNRLKYDTCAYSKALSKSVAPIDYVLNPIKYEHCNKCRMELGLVGGTAVSHINGNLVDLENDLMNITRPSTRCPDYKYHPGMPGEPIMTPKDPEMSCGRKRNPMVDTTMTHLAPCQMVQFPEIPHPPVPAPFTCGPRR
ncbi:hypothetical protein HYH03_015934 [Edaphochlamys debaryana]|uniref:Uncharacterized protein n=1 Tax=Edaphochlamys debaryana TaxID=47281 RepID=A0A836BS52_9CHLO|nr:hypothetical protein HYH03_015934 [Edaphochlamys debaryana]|eukprot:KAG2485353.1 hypothetical protein HYH03_015934 [Edaphochlamys debaryana]